MKIVQRKIDDLIPYENNPRINDHAVEKVARAIDAFGFRVPVLIRSDGSVIDGHLRLKAAKALYMKEVPCLLADDMTDAQVRAFRISVNKVAELAEWDEGLLAAELRQLCDDDVDFCAMGYEDHEVDSLLGDQDPDEGQEDIPDRPVMPVTIRNDLWMCGEHAIFCGSATFLPDLETVMGGYV